MDRIKRLSMQILEIHKDRFSTDFGENKKVLDEISIVRSKELKNELAGFITKFIKREIRKQKEKEEKLKKESQIVGKEDAEDQNSVISEQVVEKTKNYAETKRKENPST